MLVVHNLLMESKSIYFTDSFDVRNENNEHFTEFS